MSEISATGKWLDRATGKVVDKPPTGPEGGRLIVARGGPITPDIRRFLDEHDTPDPSAPSRDGDGVETATAPAAETATAPRGRR